MNASRGKLRALVGALMLPLLGLSLIGAAPASAAEVEEPVQSCWIDLPSETTVCFDPSLDVADVIFELTGQTLVYSTDDAARSESALLLAVGAILYEHHGLDGSSVTMTVPDGGCPGYVTNWPTMPSGWNDRVSSFATYSSCKATLYENTSMSGAQFGPSFTNNIFGVMDDKTSSVRLTS